MNRYQDYLTPVAKRKIRYLPNAKSPGAGVDGRVGKKQSQARNIPIVVPTSEVIETTGERQNVLVQSGQGTGRDPELRRRITAAPKPPSPRNPPRIQPRRRGSVDMISIR
mmetsp:Transcript_29942/g.45165  ORF Transcript_29942/g.45165 Transcript_29942/m.45165 type:complete len:110 (+) Transcript_29942:372-701(+)